MQASIKTNIEHWLKEKLQEEDLFLVEVKLVANKVQIFVDGMVNVTIDQCAEISKLIGDKLDKEPGVSDNYTLEVSSPGMSNPLRVPQQYKKRMGKELDILLNDGTKVEGILKAQDDLGITIEIEKKEKTAKKSKAVAVELPVEQRYIELANIKKAIVKFNFKQ